MIDATKLFSIFKKNRIEFYTGVPDSCLKFMNSFLEKLPKNKHIIAHNEGGAIGLAIGYHLNTNNLSVVYMQNSGLGNAINPLISMCAKNIYSIPMVLVIGWRGSPNKHDEEQHLLTGNITIKLLKLIKIPFLIIRKNSDFLKINSLINFSKEKKIPVAILFENNKSDSSLKFISNNKIKKNKYSNIFRFDALNLIIKNIKDDDLLISTTGFTSRELNNLRLKNRSKKIKNKGKDFYVVGGMGHASAIALGSSINKKKFRKTICLDGDGSTIMHMGSLATNGYYACRNFKHILFNNYQHESVGGQKTVANNLDFKKISLGCGYQNYFNVSKYKNLYNIINLFLKAKGPSFLEIIIKPGSIQNLGRPDNLKIIKEKILN